VCIGDFSYMFSKDFMRYLINYQPDGYNCAEQQLNTVKEIKFKDNNKGILAKVYVTLNKK